jgi:nicotinate-nucleotide adenylyltransferase
MPMGQAPHRQIDQDPGAEVRARLCDYAVAPDERLTLSRLEVDRQGPSYTVDTLRLLRERSPEDELTLILGADQAARLASWRDPEGVLSLAAVAVAARAGLEQGAVLRHLDGLAGSERIAFFDIPRVDVSSTLVRERAASGRPIRYLVPDRVADYVEANRLYGAGVPVSAE